MREPIFDSRFPISDFRFPISDRIRATIGFSKLFRSGGMKKAQMDINRKERKDHKEEFVFFANYAFFAVKCYSTLIASKRFDEHKFRDKSLGNAARNLKWI
jgi:hypothetical protein